MSSNGTSSSNPAVGQDAFPPPTEPPPAYDQRALPPGWVKEFDPKTSRYFYVDTVANPPRSIWVHPFDDPEFIRSSDAISIHEDPSDSEDNHHGPPSHDQDQKGDSKDHTRLAPHSSHSSRPSSSASNRSNEHRTDAKGKGKERGFFGKLKDKTIGTKEERRAAHERRVARRKEEERQYIEYRKAVMEQRRQEIEREREFYRQRGQQYPFDSYDPYDPYNRGRRYGPPGMNAYGGPAYQPPYTYGSSPYGRSSRGSGGAGGLALIGGLATGLLLGDLLF